MPAATRGGAPVACCCDVPPRDVGPERIAVRGAVAPPLVVDRIAVRGAEK